MRAVVQRVSSASVEVDGRKIASIQRGLVVLLGVESLDSPDDADWLARKVASLRIFADAQGLMNHDLNTVKGEVLCISQFTLFARTKKGNRPSFIRSASPDFAIPLYEHFIDCMQYACTGKVASGKFGAMMQVSLVNDGPVTLIIDTKNKE